MLHNIIPILGIAVFVLLSGSVSEMSSVGMNLKSNLIVLAGSFTCCLISYPIALFRELFANIRQAFSRKSIDFYAIIDEIEELSRIRRREGVLAMDHHAEDIEDSFLKTGIEMIADGYDRYAIFKTLERRYDHFLKSCNSQLELLHTMIRMMPVFGFVGTIIGLINVLQQMGTPELIGKGVATALLTTFYGLLYANIVFLPMARKLGEKIRQESAAHVLMIEGIMDIADGLNPKAIHYRLRNCIGEVSVQESQHRQTGKAAPIPRGILPSVESYAGK